VRSIKQAIGTDLSRLEFKRGGSTITQQVVKNLLLGKEKSLRRKAREIILAGEVEKRFDKAKVLEIYLNTVELGPEVRGLWQASHYYFQKEPSELTAKEGAFLAMLLPSPVRYGKSFRDGQLTPYARKTIDRILKRMLACQKITPGQFERETRMPLPFEKGLEADSKFSIEDPST
jgi:monofunctional biosynthetic peptidoglycan transglycosylase